MMHDTSLTPRNLLLDVYHGVTQPETALKILEPQMLVHLDLGDGIVACDSIGEGDGDGGSFRVSTDSLSEVSCIDCRDFATAERR
jgi:hypothetical protein